MDSENRTDEAFVWIWLPDATQPVVAGRLAHARDGRLTFNYGQSHLARADGIAIDAPELPLRAGAIETHNNMLLPSSIRDGSPDAWGRRVIINSVTGLKGDRAVENAYRTVCAHHIQYIVRQFLDPFAFEGLPDGFETGGSP